MAATDSRIFRDYVFFDGDCTQSPQGKRWLLSGEDIRRTGRNLLVRIHVEGLGI